MNTVYDFENKEPPKINEKMLREELKRRELRLHIILLTVSSVLTFICAVLFAFLIAADSLVAAIAVITGMCIALSGVGIIAVLYLSKKQKMKQKNFDCKEFFI